jgi:hypothetical protein
MDNRQRLSHDSDWFEFWYICLVKQGLTQLALIETSYSNFL